MFRKSGAVRIAGILQLMEDGHGFILQEKGKLSIEIAMSFCSGSFDQKYGLRPGNLLKDSFARKWMNRPAQSFCRLKK